jgi:hydrogenase maturation factor HypF (carbamoyltransferase family)
MTRKAKKADKITMLEPIEEPESLATCKTCHTSFFTEREAKIAYVTCMCPNCGAFMETTSIQFSFAKTMPAYWRKGRNGKKEWTI